MYTAVNKKLFISAITSIIAGIFILLILVDGWYKIDTGERGVHLRNGAIIRVVDAGLYFKLPVFDSAHKISTRTHTVQFAQVQAYSKDQQPAVIRASVTYHVPAASVEQVYQHFKDVETLINNTVAKQVPNQIENTFGTYSAVGAVQDRAQFVAAVTSNLRASLAEIPVSIDLVQIENIDFSAAYEESIEARMRAEVEVTTQRQNLEKERINAEIAVTQAQAIADSRLVQAKADAEAIRLRGEAEAHAIRVRAQALAANAALVELTKAERWDGKLPTTMLPNSAIPFISAKP